MAKTPEKIVKDKVIAVLKEEGVYYFLPATGGYGRSGVPDVVGCVRGWFLAIECKAGKGKPTALQLREMSRITEAGGCALIVREDSIEDLRGIVRELKGRLIT